MTVAPNPERELRAQAPDSLKNPMTATQPVRTPERTSEGADAPRRLTAADPHVFDRILVALSAAGPNCRRVRVQTSERTVDIRTAELRRALAAMRLLAVAEQHRDSRRVAMATRILSRCSADAIDVIRNIDATRLTPLRSK